MLLYPVVFAYSTLHIRIAPLGYSLILLTTVVLYLLACDPLAPCAGVLKEWLRRMARSRVAAAPESTRAGGFPSKGLTPPGVNTTRKPEGSAAVLERSLRVRRDRDPGPQPPVVGA